METQRWMRKLEQITPAEYIIMKKLGGLTKTASLLSTPDKAMAVSTVQGWKERGKIPQEWWMPLIEAAKSNSVDLSLQMFLSGADAENEVPKSAPSRDWLSLSPEEFKSIRNELGLTRSQFSEKLGTSEVVLTRIEMGARAPSIEMISKVRTFVEGTAA